MWVKFFAQSAVLSHPISSGIPIFSDFFVQNIRAKKRSVTSGDSSPDREARFTRFNYTSGGNIQFTRA